jgi:hypothetical protein
MIVMMNGASPDSPPRGRASAHAGSRWSEENRTPGLVFGSTAAGTPTLSVPQCYKQVQFR